MGTENDLPGISLKDEQRQLLIWLNTPDDILVMADAYIKVIFI